MAKSIKSARKAGAKKTRPVEPEVVTPAGVDLEAVRGEVRNLICDEAVEMAGAVIEQAKGGHYQAMKCLFEMIGLFPAVAPEEKEKEDSLAGMLLNRLGIAEGTHPEAAVPKNGQGTKLVLGNNVK